MFMLSDFDEQFVRQNTIFVWLVVFIANGHSKINVQCYLQYFLDPIKYLAITEKLMQKLSSPYNFLKVKRSEYIL